MGRVLHRADTPPGCCSHLHCCGTELHLHLLKSIVSQLSVLTQNLVIQESVASCSPCPAPAGHSLPQFSSVAFSTTGPSYAFFPQPLSNQTINSRKAGHHQTQLNTEAARGPGARGPACADKVPRPQINQASSDGWEMVYRE